MLSRPKEREKLVLHIHEELRHFRVKRSYNLLQNQYGGLISKHIFNELFLSAKLVTNFVPHLMHLHLFCNPYLL